MHNQNGHLAKSSQRPGCACVLGGVLRGRQVCDDLISTLSAPLLGRPEQNGRASLLHPSLREDYLWICLYTYYLRVSSCLGDNHSVPVWPFLECRHEKREREGNVSSTS